MSADRCIIVAILALGVSGAVLPAAAQMVAKPPIDAKAAQDTKAADAAKALATGTKAFESGRTDAAVAALTTAIMSGALKNPELAKAFFYRGVAQRTQKKPGAALSDLNAAVWLRDGLSATDKAVAEDHRQALLREVAGVAGAPPVTAAAPVESAAAPVAAVAAAAPVPAANPPPAPAPAAVEAPAQSASLFSWLTPDPAPPAVQAPVEPVQPAPPKPIAQTAAPAEPAASPPVEDKPLPWAAPEPEAKTAPEPPAPVAAAPEPAVPMPADTVGEPVASVASVERGTITPLHAEPAPPEKPLPWQVAAAEPEISKPLPWASGSADAPAPAPAVAAPAPSEPVAAAAAPDPAPPVPPAASPAPPVDIASATAETASNAVAAASSSLANAGQTATQFLGSLFAGGGGDSNSTPQASEEQTAPAVQAASLNDAPASPPTPATWPAETTAAPPPARIETASISTRVEAAAANAEPAWSAETKSPPPAAKPAVLAVAQPVAEPVAAPQPTPTTDVAQPAAMPGPYRLQIAAENSREEAEQTVTRLVAKHKTSLKGLEPVIEEPQTGNVLFGSMGAAYRVSLGPYQTAVEPGRLCNILQPHGFDCRVVAVTP
jgi:hypothetical protein